MRRFNTGFVGLALFVLGVVVSACTQSVTRLSPDFGDALHEDLQAQIAYPDARYTGTPAPGSDGARVDLAQKRYEKNRVIQPSDITASNPGVVNAPANGGGANDTAGTIGPNNP
ncbi:MAG TPA: hypothetical protein VMU22_00805 [Rhizomicrobium sp.]|nr:hypothetical protein [Rhizomicrobium sp.]